jgi:hypothetical protein
MEMKLFLPEVGNPFLNIIQMRSEKGSTPRRIGWQIVRLQTVNDEF